MAAVSGTGNGPGSGSTMSFSEYVGPYETWVYENGVKFMFPDGLPDASSHFTALAEWTDPVSLDDIPSEVEIEVGGGESRTYDIVPLLSGDPDRYDQVFRFLPLLFSPQAPEPCEGYDCCSALTNLMIAAGSEQSGIFRLNFPVDAAIVGSDRDPAGDPDYQPDPDLKDEIENDDRPLVVVGVIDDGLPFAHRNFQTDDGRSRIEFCWLQSALAEPVPWQGHVSFGRELTRHNIETLIDDHWPDEDRIYLDRQAGAVNDLPDLGHNIFRPYTHGAHVMDTAAGFTRSEQAQQNRDNIRIVAVQLPRNSLRDTSGFGKDVFVLSALHYIFERACRVGRAYGASTMTLLVNVSLGVTGGPHDGRSQLEAAIDELVDFWKAGGGDVDDAIQFDPVRLALPSANSFIDRMHGRFAPEAFADGAPPPVVPWRVQPNDRTSSYLELWFDAPPDADLADAFRIRVYAPSGDRIRKLKGFGSGKIKKLKVGGKTIGQLSADRFRNGKWRVLVVLGPTERTGGKGPAAPSGLWRIKITKSDPDLSDISVRCYVHRDEDPAGTGNGARQSFLDDPTYATHNEMGKPVGVDGDFVKRFGTLNGWATYSETASPQDKQRFAVAGYVGRFEPITQAEEDWLQPALYSSAGLVSDDASRVDVSQVSDTDMIIPGVAGAGTRSGAHGYLIGTSGAAPAYIRELALMAAEASPAGGTTDAGSETVEFPEDSEEHARLGLVHTRNRRRDLLTG